MAKPAELEDYIYSGPLTGFSYVDADGKQRDVQLVDGEPVRLPPDHPHVRDLVATEALRREVAAVMPKPRAGARSAAPDTKEEE